ncbi:MAG: hypothetical protein KDA53_08580 [Hyphomonas sp.]|nr:hypothetical protein [Hyphomonas sp.]
MAHSKEDKEFNETLKRMMAKPKPHEEVKDAAREKREAERRKKQGPIDPLKRWRKN